MAKVVILAPVHRADDVRVFQRQARSLVESGLEVVLIAGQKPVKSFSGLPIRLIIVPWAGQRAARLKNLPKLFRVAWRERPDVYLLHNPDTLPIGFLLWLFRQNVVYDSHEDFSQRMLTRDWVPGFFRPLLGLALSLTERLAAVAFDALLVTQEAQLRRFSGKATLIRNLPVTTGPNVQAAHVSARLIDRRADYRLVYLGAIHPSRGLFEMLNLVAGLNRDLNVRLWLIGELPRSVASSAMAHIGWQYVDELGLLPQAEAFAYLLNSDIGLIFLDDVADYSQTSPNKLYEYMQFGLCFLASDFIQWRQDIDEALAGVFVDSRNEEAVLDEAHRLLLSATAREEMGARGKLFIDSKWNWGCETTRFLSVIREAAGLD